MKTLKDVQKFMKPLYKKGKPFILKEKDYILVNKILSKGKKYGVMYYMDEPVYLDTLKTKTKTSKLPCRWCNKTNGVIKFYILADNLEEPKAYHPGCMRQLEMEVIMKLSDVTAQIN